MKRACGGCCASSPRKNAGRCAGALDSRYRLPLTRRHRAADNRSAITGGDRAMATVFALREKWAKGETVFGMFASLPSAFACEVATIKGVDYVCVDQQHGVCDWRDMVEMARAIDARGSVPLTRVPAGEDWIIGKCLDAGAQGVIIPMVSNPEQACKAVAACRYPPKGERSNGPARAAIVMGTRDH